MATANQQLSLIVTFVVLIAVAAQQYAPVAQASVPASAGLQPIGNLINANSNELNNQSVIQDLVRHSSSSLAINNNNNNNNNNNEPNSAPSSLPSGTAFKFVRLGTSNAATNNSSHPNTRNFNYNSHLISTSSRRQHQANNNQYLTNKPTSESHASNLRTYNETICIGTSNRMSGQHNKTGHYQQLADRYRNCTHVIGNLEITWLEKGQDKKSLDLTFLESIREITGYLLIAYVDVEKIRMPNLQIIRGRDLFKLNNGNEEFAMFLIENELKTLELPNLREIISGSVGSYNNRNLCIKQVDWNELLNGPFYKTIFVYNGTAPECPPCDNSCSGGCWGEGPELCQKFSKTICSPQCSQGRCFGPLPRDCCHLFCAGGCTGPMQTECIACKNFSDDGECIQECPLMQRYNPSKFLWEPNPNGKYAFGATCVKECPPHLLRDNGACVRTCPENKRNIDGECVPCSGPCPKNCQGVAVVHSGNIDQLINCTAIEGSITILDSSFYGYAEVINNSQIGPIYDPMHPSRLKVFETVHEITGFLSIQANHSDFKNLSYFRNLEIIGGRQTTDMFYALSIIKTSLESLNLRSLKKVRSGRVLIEENRDLCLVDTIDWSRINNLKHEDVTIRNNANSTICRSNNLHCHEQCSRNGCWGPGQNECLACKNYKLDDYCVNDCASTQAVGFLSYDSGSRSCKKCHPECKNGCNGTQNLHCKQCKSVKDGPYCVAECPSHKYNNNGVCEECDKSCADGCTGPSNRLGENGCNSCHKAVINSTSPNFLAYCTVHDHCPEGFYQEYIGSHAESPLKSSLGKTVCRRCHHRCKSCTGMGSHVSVCECAKYQANEQCEDHCPRDYFADDQLRRCVKCSPECNGCYGPTEADCKSCRVYRIYYDSVITNLSMIQSSNRMSSGLDYEHSGKQPVLKFNCTAQCPPEKPHRISESNRLDPYCSEDPGYDPENPRVVSIFGSTSLVLMLIISAGIMFCISVYRCQLEKDKTVKLTMHLSGIDDVEPLNPSNMKPNLAPLRSIKETELRKGNILGSGFGGTVYQGFWYPEGQEHKEPRPVAIKVLRDNGQSNMNKEFLDEAYIMASVNHPNLVRLLAVCMTPNHLMLVTQLMPLGCLLEYVKNHKNEIGSKNLLEWCKQIARGMSYLEERRMVHRDLALRNVLLQTSGRALISDFGLAKFLDLDQSEYHSGGGRLPIKWLAPECIRERKFTPKSDVWAFGVTVWELLTFGMQPFQEYDTKDVPAAIETGARLQQPAYMSAEVYKVMYACWFYNPEDRPNFKSMVQSFVTFARDPERYLICGSKGLDCSGKLGQHDLSLESDDNDYSSNQDASTTGEDDLQLTTMPDLTPTTHNRLNEIFGFEFRRHSDQSGINQLNTPNSMKKMFVGNHGQHLINEDLFANSVKSIENNAKSSASLTLESTDLDDYLLPSPCSNDDKFSKFLASHEGHSSRLPPARSSAVDPPHSAGLIGISNDEYFLTRINYVNSNGSHGTTNASSGHIPHSLV